MSWKEAVLKRIKPTPGEEKKVRALVDKILAASREVSGLEAITCGSFGKGTWLAGDLDVDIFIKFPKETERAELEKKGLEFGKKIVAKLGGKWRIKYAEHPYVHAIVEGFDVDVVPCYSILPGEHIKSAVDRSPLHLAHVNQNLKPKLFDEVRLLKQFMKGSGVYGSDTKTQGFAGYIAELLVMKFGSFEAVVKEAAAWKAGTAMTVDGSPGKKFPAPLTIIDPVDANRNVAAAVNAENFARFVHSCKSFLQKPSDSYFSREEAPLSAAETKTLQQRDTQWLAVVMKRPDVIDDVLWPQLRRARGRLVQMLADEEFHSIRALEWAGDEAGSDILLLLELEVWSLPHIKHMMGPPVYVHNQAENFVKKYRKSPFGPVVRGENWYIEKPREFHKASDMVQALQKKSEKELLEAGLPNNIAPAFGKARLLEGKAWWAYLDKNKGLSKYLRRAYFEKMA